MEKYVIINSSKAIILVFQNCFISKFLLKNLPEILLLLEVKVKAVF